MQKDSKVPKYTEFELKYEVDWTALETFRSIVKKHLPDHKINFLHGYDVYYTNKDSFIRYRTSPYKVELTTKVKMYDSNTWRKEINLNISNNDPNIILEFVKSIGFEQNFKIHKRCYGVWHDEVSLVLYEVSDEADPYKTRWFFEIEINEGIIDTLTFSECYAILKIYELMFRGLGINYDKRLSESLFELYRK